MHWSGPHGKRTRQGGVLWMSDCKLPKKIVKSKTITVTITGNYYSTSYGYVQIGSTKYTSNQSLSYTIPPATAPSITVYCWGTGSAASHADIRVNGNIVSQATSSVPATYTFIPNGDCTITLTRGSSGGRQYWRATIT